MARNPGEGDDRSDDFREAAATFGDRLGFAREAKGLSEGELARRMGVRLGTLRDWERDRAEPRATRLQILAATVDAPMVWLMSGEGPGPAAIIDREAEEAPGGRAAACLRELRRIRSEQARLAARMARVEKQLSAALGRA